MSEVDRIDVHQSHCCVIHGCKYGEDEDCPVVNGSVEQDFDCENCWGDGGYGVGTPTLLDLEFWGKTREGKRVQGKLRHFSDSIYSPVVSLVDKKGNTVYITKESAKIL